MTYQDADTTFHEAEQIQAHFHAQDDALNTLLGKIKGLEGATPVTDSPVAEDAINDDVAADDEVRGAAG